MHCSEGVCFLGLTEVRALCCQDAQNSLKVFLAATRASLSFPSPLPDDLEADSTEKFVQRQLEADVEISEFTVTGRDLVKAHFVNDGFDLVGVVSE